MPELASLTLSTCSLFLLSILMYSYLYIYIYIFIKHITYPRIHHMRIHHPSILLSLLLNLSLYICIFLLLRTPPQRVVSPPLGLELTLMGKPSTCKSPTYRANTSRSILSMLTHTNRYYADLHISFYTHHLAISLC